MSSITCDMYYVGHGNMFYIEVTNSAGIIEKKILVDAGSTSDTTGTGASASLAAVMERINATPAQLIVCVTHMHLDHYGYLKDIFRDFAQNRRWDLLDHVYIGSGDWDQYYCAETLNDICYLVKANQRPLTFLNCIDTEKSLWMSSERDVKLSVLFNRIVFGDENDKSAAFFLKHTSSDTGIFFTGDITGLTMEYFNCHIAEMFSLNRSLKDCRIYMTAPHHGSIDTLEKADFIIRKQMCSGDRLYSRRKLQNFLRDTGVIHFALMISYGVDDMFGHPDLWVTAALDIYAGWSTRMLKSFPAFRTYSHNGYTMPSTNRITYRGNDWYIFKTDKCIYTTVGEDLTNNTIAPQTEQIHIP